jgi:hypothetical protein
VLYHDVLLIVLQAKEGFYAMLDESKDLEVTAGYRPKFSRARDMLELDPRWQVGCRDGWQQGWAAGKDRRDRWAGCRDGWEAGMGRREGQKRQSNGAGKRG